MTVILVDPRRPALMPVEAVELLADAINKTLAEPATRDRLVALGYSPAMLGGTRPAEFRGWEVPEVLRSGHHAEIERWRAEQVGKR